MRYIYLLIPAFVIIIVLYIDVPNLDTRIEYGNEDWINRYPLDATDSYQLIDSIEDLSIYSEHIIIGRVSNLTSLIYHSNDPYIKELEKHGNTVIDIEIDVTGNYNSKHISFLHRYTPTISIGDKVLIFLYKGDDNTVWEDKYLANGIFKIIDNKVYHYFEYPDGIDLDQLIKIIKEYRSVENRL
jgi:hypothetical protein